MTGLGSAPAKERQDARALPATIAVGLGNGGRNDKTFKAACAAVGDLLAVVDAARKFADDELCLDENCGHKVCVLNKALARLPKERS